MAAVVRVADEDDVSIIAEMGHRFVDATAYVDRAVHDDTHFRALAEQVMTNGRVFVAEVDGAVIGMLGAVMITHPVLNERMGAEVIWWVEPEHRRSGAGAELFRAAEEWAASEGAVKMQFSAYRDRLLERLYRRLGYTAKEVIFEKELTHVGEPLVQTAQ